MHGARAPQVRNKALQRLRDLVHPAISALEYLLEYAESDAVRFATAKDILDRCGFRTIDRVQHSDTTTITIEYVNDWQARPQERPRVLPRRAPEHGVRAS